MKIRNCTLPICFLAPLAFLSLQGQDNVNSDSLLSLVNKNPHDTVKIATYLSLNKILSTSDTTQSKYFLEKAMLLSETQQDKIWLCRSMLRKCDFLWRKGQLASAKQVLDNVEEHCAPTGNTEMYALFQNQWGI